jgi:hypothetical protein
MVSEGFRARAIEIETVGKVYKATAKPCKKQPARTFLVDRNRVNQLD